MPIGTGIFLPQGQFAAPRSYWRGVAFNIAGYTVAQAAHSYTWTKITDPGEIWTITFDARFLPWTSNRWTFDRMVTDFYYTLAPSPTQHPQPYSLRIRYSPTNYSPYLEFRFDVVDFAAFVYQDFPAAPANYWPGRWL